MLGLLAAGIPAPEAPSCAESLLQDWYDDMAFETTYDPECYREALKTLPEDVRVYTSAVDDIERALREVVAEGDAGSRSLSNVRQPTGAEEQQTAAPPPAPALAAETPSRLPPLPLLVVTLALTLALGASAGVFLRRRRE
jgi:hypothetical protein